jgi:hypothetical protein
MTNTTLSEAALQQFIGTENWHRHGINRNVLYTDGAKFVADAGGAYWLLDTIAICQLDPRVKAEEFQVWKLTVRPDRTASSSARTATTSSPTRRRFRSRISRWTASACGSQTM